MVRIKEKQRIIFLNIDFLFILAIIWKMIEEFEPPPWASEDMDDDI